MDNTLILPEQFRIIQLDRGFRPTSNRSWSRNIKAIYGNKCFISGETAETAVIVSHHLYNRKNFKELHYSVLNGIPLTEANHKVFHKLFGMYATPLHFKKFLELIYVKGFYSDQDYEKRIDWIDFLDRNILKDNEIALNKVY